MAVRGARPAIEGIRWHRISLGDTEPYRHNGLPTTALERIPLDCAKDLSSWDLKGILAELEHHFDIAPEDLTTAKGVDGSARLGRAIQEHTPQLAQTRSELERAFIRFLIARGLQLPIFNHPAGLTTVDAVFKDQRLIVELDGVKGHRGDRRILRDHRRDLHRRADGFTVLRYAFAQFTPTAA